MSVYASCSLQICTTIAYLSDSVQSIIATASCKRHCQLKRCTRTKFGERGFSFAGPAAWNNLLYLMICSTAPTDAFKNKLKTFYLPTCIQHRLILFRFLQRVSIAFYAECCISYDRFCLTVRLSQSGIMPKFVHIRRRFLLGRLQTCVRSLKSTNLPFSSCRIFVGFRNNVGINCTLRQHTVLDSYRHQ